MSSQSYKDDRKAQEAYQARMAAERREAHNEAIAAYNKAQRALQDAQNLVAYLEAEVERTMAVCVSFMPPKDPS
jgi:cell fate (sporulation/competence/biofilm development) regulator YlbF (YheA/YmcA/DUF963 family)